MLIKVIPKYRALLLPCSDLGTVHENKATTLEFDIPDDLEEYTTRNFIVFNSAGSHIFPLSENRVEISNLATKDPSADIQLVLNTPSGKEWSSQPYHINFYNRIDDSGENIFNELKKQWATEAQRPLTILVNRVTEKVTELLNERRNKP